MPHTIDNKTALYNNLCLTGKQINKWISLCNNRFLTNKQIDFNILIRIQCNYEQMTLYNKPSLVNEQMTLHCNLSFINKLMPFLILNISQRIKSSFKPDI